VRHPASQEHFMLGALAKSLFGSSNDRYVKSLGKTVAQIAAFEPTISKPSPPCARPPSACSGMRHFDVQMIGGMVLHEGEIAEMRTGEGKTLVATLPVYLNALEGKGVHVVTVNDYLAKRDAEWMGRSTLPRPDHRRDRARPRRRRAPRRLCLRHHLRHQQRASASTICATT
jgi:hypothetical protein